MRITSTAETVTTMLTSIPTSTTPMQACFIILILMIMGLISMDMLVNMMMNMEV